MTTHQSIFQASAIALLLAISGCSNDSSEVADAAASCPPAPKSGLSAIKRAGGVENFEKYRKWQTSLPPESCAGDLAAFIPALPEGYGLPPNVRPPIFNEQHVYLRYVKMPESLQGDALEMFNFAQQPQYEFEIVQLTKEQADKFKTWLADNPKSYSEYPIEDRMFYATGGGVWYMPGHKLTGGIGTILKNNVLIKVSMPRMYADETVAEPVTRLFHELAEKKGV